MKERTPKPHTLTHSDNFSQVILFLTLLALIVVPNLPSRVGESSNGQKTITCVTATGCTTLLSRIA